MLAVQQSQRLEGIGGRVHGGNQRWNAREDVAPNTHMLLNIGVRGQHGPLLGLVVDVCHGCTLQRLRLGDRSEAERGVRFPRPRDRGVGARESYRKDEEGGYPGD